MLAGDFWEALESILIELLVILLLGEVFRGIQVHPLKNVSHDERRADLIVRPTLLHHHRKCIAWLVGWKIADRP